MASPSTVPADRKIGPYRLVRIRDWRDDGDEARDGNLLVSGAGNPSGRRGDAGQRLVFAFCPCPPGTNALGRMSIAVTRPYWLGEAPVTWRQWRAVRGEKFEGRWNGQGGAPATYLTCDEASSFCARLTRRFAKELPEGYEIRLPTVAEWRLAYQVGQTVCQGVKSAGSDRAPTDSGKNPT